LPAAGQSTRSGRLENLERRREPAVTQARALRRGGEPLAQPNVEAAASRLRMP